MTDSAGDSSSAAASNVIRIDGVLVLTGALGLIFLFVSWFIASAALVVLVPGAQSLMTDEPDILKFGGYLLFAVVDIIFAALVWIVTRWIGRGLLEGRKASAIVAIILMIGFAFLLLGHLRQSEPVKASLAIVQSLSALALSLLLIVSFRNRVYWRRVR